MSNIKLHESGTLQCYSWYEKNLSSLSEGIRNGQLKVICWNGPLRMLKIGKFRCVSKWRQRGKKRRALGGEVVGFQWHKIVKVGMWGTQIWGTLNTVPKRGVMRIKMWATSGLVDGKLKYKFTSWHLGFSAFCTSVAIPIAVDDKSLRALRSVVQSDLCFIALLIWWQDVN